MRLLPQKTTFFDLFDQQAAIVVDICKEVRDMLHVFDNLPERQRRVKELENRCDELTHRLATEMHATFITPLDKEDIAAMSSRLDDIADYADAAADRILLYQIPEITPEARELGDYLVQCATVLQTAVAALRHSKERDTILKACRDLHRLEHESDAVYRRALGKLFNTPGIDPIMVIKWKETYERLEIAVDKCEYVSDIIERIQLKYG